MTTSVLPADLSGRMYQSYILGSTPNSAVLTATDANHNYNHITGATSTLVKTGSGFLRAVIVNQAATTVTIYDGTSNSGTVIAVIGAATGSFTYDVAFTVGLYIVPVGAGTDVTVSYL